MKSADLIAPTALRAALTTRTCVCIVQGSQYGHGKGCVDIKLMGYSAYQPANETLGLTGGMEFHHAKGAEKRILPLQKMQQILDCITMAKGKFMPRGLLYSS